MDLIPLKLVLLQSWSPDQFLDARFGHLGLFSDVLVQGWDRGKPVVFDVTVSSPLTPVTLNNASTSVGAAAYAAELRKHVANETPDARSWGGRVSP